MHCASCKLLIEKMVGKQEGVISVSVNYATEKMTVEYDEKKISEADLKQAVASAGSYQLVSDTDGNMVLADPGLARNMATSKSEQAAQIKKNEFEVLRRKTILVAIGSIPFWLIMGWMGLDFFGLVEMQHMPLGKLTFETFNYSINLFFLVQFLLATPILFWGGSQFFTSAWSALKVRAANMDSLIVLGTLSAWVFSSIVTFFPQIFGEVANEVFFEASVFIVLFILLGRLMESKAKGQANKAIQRLLELQAKEAHVIRDGEEITIPIAQVKVGEKIIVRPGEKVPVDGLIIEGSSTLDESMVTGESMPVTRGKGEKVIGATINKTSTFTFEAEVVGSGTLLAQIVKMVEEAQGSTAPIQKLADKISGIFVPAVIAIAILAFLFWLVIAGQNIQFAVYVATTVLIIACPCALGLATPTAVMVGSGKAAKLGILIKDAEALQLAQEVGTIIFDKTGTLTNGKPEVTDFKVLEGESHEDLLKIAYVVEKNSEHPLSNAIVDYADGYISEEINLGVSGFENIEGRGVRAEVDGVVVAIGNRKLMLEIKSAGLDNFAQEEAHFTSGAKSIAYLSKDGKVMAIFAIADKIKEGAIEAISSLHAQNIKVVMLTGDNQKTAEAIATQLGIDEVISEVLPAEKAAKVKDYQKQATDGKVAMIGDGINDAPALAQADIGLAMGTGTDIAIESADIILVSGSLDKLVETIKLSRSTLRVIKQNLVWAFGYNLIAIPIAAGVMYPVFGILLSPIIASAAMAFSSVSVVLNSLRLK